MNELFTNTHDALTFAFHYSSQQYAISPMAKLIKTGSVGSGKGLVAMDGAAQSGMIRARVDRLDAIHRACVIARYSPRFEECRCCGGHEKMLAEYREAIAALGQWALSTFSGLSTRVARELVIRAFYENGLSIRVVAERSNLSKSTLHDYKAKIFAKLKEVDHLAQLEIDGQLQNIFTEV